MAGGFTASIYRCSPVRADIQDDPNHLHDPRFPSVSARHCKSFSADICNRGPEYSQKSRLFSPGTWHPCLLPAIFEDYHRQKQEREENVIRLEIEKPIELFLLELDGDRRRV